MNVAYCLVGEIIINEKNYTDKCKITSEKAFRAQRENTNLSVRKPVRWMDVEWKTKLETCAWGPHCLPWSSYISLSWVRWEFPGDRYSCGTP